MDCSVDPAVHVLETRHVGPDVLQPDGEQQATRVDLAAVVEDELKVRLVAALAAQLRRFDARQPEKTVDATRLPIARIARVDEHDAVEIAREPDARGQSRRSSADDGRIVQRVVWHGGKRSKKNAASG